MKEDQELVEAVLRREIERLEGRRRELRAAFQELVARFSGAEKLREEIEALEEGDRAFLKRVRGLNLEKWREVIGEELRGKRALLEEGAGEVELEYRGDRFLLKAPRGGAGEEGGDGKRGIGGSFMEKLLESEEPRGMVSYPIIFTHQGEENQQALAGSLLWAQTAAAAEELLSREEGASEAVILKGEGFSLKINGKGKGWREEIPGADRFGFEERGEIFRRLEEFHRADPEAHWAHWLGAEKRGGEREEFFLREQGGALLQVIVEPEAGRIRERRRSRTGLVRKRMNLFVEEPEVKVRDRYFSSPLLLERGLLESLREWIAQGFRIVFWEGEGRESRGIRPR